MTASLSNLKLSLEQTSDQRALGVVALSYGYTLTNSSRPDRKESGEPYAVTIDILGDDVVADDLLASQVDLHEVHCAADASKSVERHLVVSQAVLDEDLGDDEIKLRICVKRGNESAIEAITPIVQGKF